MQTISELEKKTWYRLLKVIYIVFVLLVLLFAGGLIWSNYGSCVNCTTGLAGISYSLLTIIVTLIITEILKRTVYYIVLGKFMPMKK